MDIEHVSPSPLSHFDPAELLDVLSTGVIMLDSQLCVVYANVGAQDLLAVPTGDITEEGLRLNVDVGIQYLESWLGGNGCVPIYNLMEDAATAEICRAQVWQWVKFGAKLDDGRSTKL